MKDQFNHRRISQYSGKQSSFKEETGLPIDISQLNAALRHSMTFSQNFLNEDREVSINVNDSMSQAALHDNTFLGDRYNMKRMFSTAKK
mgnify:FL=1